MLSARGGTVQRSAEMLIKELPFGVVSAFTLDVHRAWPKSMTPAWSP
ncbi:MAG: hypothetical protein R2911_24610 [Caldilineaceae bacterium]